MNDADNQVDETQETPTAETQEELSIPKHRFDAVSAEVRRLREDNDIMRGHLAQVTRTSQPPAEQEDDFTELGLDPNQVKGVKALVEKVLVKERRNVSNAIGNLANKADEAEFLLEHGKEKKHYLPKMKEKQREYAAMNQFLPLDLAYKIVRVDELDAKEARDKKAKPGQAAATTTQAPAKQETADEDEPPPASATRTTAAADEDESVEAMEARLEKEHFKAGKIA